MNVDSLVQMANQIGTFFEAMPDRDEALVGISHHIRMFWAPRMREQLTTYGSRDGGTGLSPIVMDALKTHSILPVVVPVDTNNPVKAAERHAFDGASEA